MCRNRTAAGNSVERGAFARFVELDAHQLIAQEVLKVIPEIVTMDPEDVYYAMDYSKLTGVLIEAIKELRTEKDAQVDRLQSENEALRDEMAKMKARLDRLESLLTSASR